MSEPSTSLIPPPPLAQVSDDASSVGSLPYFHSSDFEESSWTNTVGYYGVPSIGLAVIWILQQGREGDEGNTYC